MNHSFGYILNRRPFRDTSMLVDIFTEDYGRICCVARPAKKRGKIVKGNLEPFKYLNVQWLGKGDVQTLTEVDERGRHSIPPSELMLGIYLNELLLLLSRQHVAMPELFSAYKYTLHKLGDKDINKQIMMQFEVYLLATLGYSLTLQTDEVINPKMRYRFSQNDGLLTDYDSLIQENGYQDYYPNDLKINGDLLIALQDLKSMSVSEWGQLRQLLDAIFAMLAPRQINARKLLKL